MFFFDKTIQSFMFGSLCLYLDKFTASSICSYNITAKVAVINDKWVQNSRMSVISYLANF